MGVRWRVGKMGGGGAVKATDFRPIRAQSGT